MPLKRRIYTCPVVKVKQKHDVLRAEYVLVFSVGATKLTSFL